MASLTDVREAFDDMGVDIGKGMEAQCECAGRSHHRGAPPLLETRPPLERFEVRGRTHRRYDPLHACCGRRYVYTRICTQGTHVRTPWGGQAEWRAERRYERRTARCCDPR